jgi:hypothetical protein
MNIFKIEKLAFLAWVRSLILFVNMSYFVYKRTTNASD